MNFQEAEAQYTDLLRQYQTGQLSADQFEQAVAGLRLQTSDGAWWQLDGNGRWLRWNGAEWEQTGKTAVTPTKTPPAKKRGRGRSCLRTLIILLLIFICSLAVVGGGGYWAIQTGRLSPLQIAANLEGGGIGEISVVNITDGRLNVDMTALETESGQPEGAGGFDLEQYEISGQGGIVAGRYEVTFRAESGSPPEMTCTLRMGRGDTYQFVAVPEGIAITLEGENAEKADDLDVLTSRLCRQ